MGMSACKQGYVCRANQSDLVEELLGGWKALVDEPGCSISIISWILQWALSMQEGQELILQGAL